MGFADLAALLKEADVALDEAVAREFMGWRADSEIPPEGSDAYMLKNVWWIGCGGKLRALVRDWHPSADPAAMVEVMAHDGWPAGRALVKTGGACIREWCVADLEAPLKWALDRDTASSEPGLAVCKAALKIARARRPR